MEIKIESTKKITNGILTKTPIHSILYSIKVTNADILDYKQFREKFLSAGPYCSDWEEIMMENDMGCYPSIRNVTGNSFEIEIEDYDQFNINFGGGSGDMFGLIKYFLVKNSWNYIKF
jgi:hypothetical protein